MKALYQRGTWSITLAITLTLFVTALIVVPLPTFAQDGQSRQWVEVYVGTQNTVFVPADCVSGIQFQTGLTQDEADQTALSDFQQATIICDTAIYDAPAGNAIAGNALNAGSAWFVNPVFWNLDDLTDEIGQPDAPIDTQAQVQRPQIQSSLINRQAWVEVQLTSAGPVVYIPATCAPGLPSFGSIDWQGSRPESISFARENQTAQQIAQAQQEIDDFTGQPGQTEAGQFNWGHEFLVTLACNTPVYLAPGGAAIDEIQLEAGQTWFASPYLWFGPTATAAPLQKPAGEVMDEQQATTDVQGQVEQQPVTTPY